VCKKINLVSEMMNGIEDKMVEGISLSDGANVTCNVIKIIHIALLYSTNYYESA